MSEFLAELLRKYNNLRTVIHVEAVNQIIEKSVVTIISALLVASCVRAGPFKNQQLSADHRVQRSTSSPALKTGHKATDLIAQAPLVAAARMRLSAARASAYGAGVLPDPMLYAQLMRMPGDPEYGSGGMIELQQTFPRWGERDGMRAMAVAEVAMAAADLAMFHAQARGALAKARAYTENAKRAEMLSELLAKSATGSARLAEVLTLHSRAQALEIAAHEVQVAAADALGRGRALLRLPIGAEVPDPGIPEVDQIDVSHNPRLRLAMAAQAQGKAQLAIAASRSRPEIGVRTGWQREGREAFDEYRVGVIVAIPVHPSAWRGPEEAALRRQDAADLDAAGATAEAVELLARVERAREQALRARAVANDTKKRLNLELETIASGAATGEPSSTAMLFERLDMLADTEVMAVMAEAEAAMAAAELWMLTPIPDVITERP